MARTLGTTGITASMDLKANTGLNLPSLTLTSVGLHIAMTGSSLMHNNSSKKITAMHGTGKGTAKICAGRAMEKDGKDVKAKLGTDLNREESR